MKNADKFKTVFGLYATELWAMPEGEFLRWLNSECTETEQGWISCSERLPEPEKKEYWICTDGGYQCQCRWTNTNHFWTDLTVDWHWHIMDVPQYSKVVAWMPLSEPYQEGEQDE